MSEIKLQAKHVLADDPAGRALLEHLRNRFTRALFDRESARMTDFKLGQASVIEYLDNLLKPEIPQND